MLCCLFFFAAAAGAAPVSLSTGPQALSGLTEGRTVAGFKASALYLNAADEPMGARFIHPGGLAVDVLFFASVPQVSVYARTPPVSEMGEPHALEHLLIGKGRIGKYLNSLLAMRLAEHTAGTYNDLTNFQFHTSAGPEGFYELLEAYLKALLHPEFTDEEIRREVRDFDVLRDGEGPRRLEEKGTVYNEMVSTMEKADARNWDQLGRMVFGPEHPLARNQGGEPSAMRGLAPEDIRRFHAARYHLGPNMSLIAALPLSWSAEEFLSRLAGIVERLEPKAPPRALAALPPAAPQFERKIRIGSFPSDDSNVPQSALFGWRPIETASKESLLRASILLSLLGGGETSYLHRDLIDQKTRRFDSGAAAVSAGIDSPPLAIPLITIDGIPAASVDKANLERLREAILRRVEWISRLKPGHDLAEVSEKARSLISSSRRSMLKFMDDPPHFGDRGSGIAWHRHLDSLAAEPGFRKSVPLKEAFDRLERQAASGLNPWGAIAREAGLLETPYVSAVRPDADLLKRDKEDKALRLSAQEKALMERFHAGDAQSALAEFELAVASKTRELDARDQEIGRPSFVKDPPLALDDADYAVEAATPTRGIVKTFFGSTPFTDISLLFDLGKAGAEDLDLLPLLSAALADVGVRTKDGERLDYVKAQERWRGEIYGLSSGDTANPRTRRYELSLSASASSPEEVEKAAEWLENYLVRRSTGPEIRARLADLLRSSIASGRDIFQQPEEAWVVGAASAYLYRDQPVYSALNGPFTGLRYQTRLRFRLEDRPELAAALAAIAEKARSQGREELAKTLAAGSGEPYEFLSFELAHLPPDSWREDFARLLRETGADAVVASTTTLARLDRLLSRVLVQEGVRVELMGNPSNVLRAEQLVRGLLRELPERASASGAAAPSMPPPAAHAALVNNGTKTGVHVASAPGPDYHSRAREDALDDLAVGVFEGAGPHAFFMQTWSAGLAYSNGVRVNPSSGRIRYYAERCPDLGRTMRFVADLARKTPLDDPFLLRYSLANAFSDYRGAEDFSARGAALAADLADGIDPETVRGFKALLLKTAAEPGALAAVRERVPRVLGRVLVGLGPKSPGSVGFVIGPDDLLSKYDAFLKENEVSEPLVRLYPRDFWP